MRIFSGIQPTGAKQFGNYSGGFRQYAATQEEGEAFFCIVDLHSITADYSPQELRTSTLDLLAMLVATGLDPDRSTIFVQSHVSAHAEAAWLLSAVTSYGQLGRMTQFKEKGERHEFVSAGLFTYPVLMAGDILLERAVALAVVAGLDVGERVARRDRHDLDQVRDAGLRLTVVAHVAPRVGHGGLELAPDHVGRVDESDDSLRLERLAR